MRRFVSHAASLSTAWLTNGSAVAVGPNGRATNQRPLIRRDSSEATRPVSAARSGQRSIGIESRGKETAMPAAGQPA